MATGIKTFEEFDKQVGKRKTGYYGMGVDMYTRRNGNRERVFRVQWFERNVKYPTHDDWKKAVAHARQGWFPRGGLGSEWVEKNQTFPYTPEGLEAALEFSKSVEPKLEAFRNRETDC